MDAHGETRNVLTWPFFASTLAYGIGFTVFGATDATSKSSLFLAMSGFHPAIPLAWGIVALVTTVMSLSFLLFDFPTFGKIASLTGFMVWLFASFCWLLAGAWLLMFAIGLPSLYFWVWQYLSLSWTAKYDALG